jgi:hypothetical protein
VIYREVLGGLLVMSSDFAITKNSYMVLICWILRIEESHPEDLVRIDESHLLGEKLEASELVTEYLDWHVVTEIPQSERLTMLGLFDKT